MIRSHHLTQFISKCKNSLIIFQNWNLKNLLHLYSILHLKVSLFTWKVNVQNHTREANYNLEDLIDWSKSLPCERTKQTITPRPTLASQALIVKRTKTSGVDVKPKEILNIGILKTKTIEINSSRRRAIKKCSRWKKKKDIMVITITRKINLEEMIIQSKPKAILSL